MYKPLSNKNEQHYRVLTESKHEVQHIKKLIRTIHRTHRAQQIKYLVTLIRYIYTVYVLYSLKTPQKVRHEIQDRCEIRSRL